MTITRLSHPLRASLGLGGIGVVTAAIYGLDRVAPALSLGPLYLFAVVPIALLWGLAYAVVASLVSMMVFNLLFLPPVHSFTLADSENWVALAIYLVTAVVVSELAARARRRASEADQQRREQTFLADFAAGLLTGATVSGQLDDVTAPLAALLGVQSAVIELGPARHAGPEEAAYELLAGGERIGAVRVAPGPGPPPSARRRFLEALASLLGVALERERLAEEVVEAEALRRSDAIKTAVLRSVSHDLHSPLTAIIAAAESLNSQRLELAPSDRAALLETIRGEAYRLERLVRDLLDLSRLDAGAASPTLELWTAEEIVAQALEDVAAEARRIEVEIAPDLPLLQVDAGQVQRALANIVENAVKFSPESQPVVVGVSATRKEVVIRVVDRGPGLAAEEAARAFEPFYRAPAWAGARGSGLGLAIARGFAEANGGRVWVESRPGAGATFALAFPAVPVPVGLRQ